MIRRIGIEEIFENRIRDFFINIIRKIVLEPKIRELRLVGFRNPKMGVNLDG